jgi:hypothetical protein
LKGIFSASGHPWKFLNRVSCIPQKNRLRPPDADFYVIGPLGRINGFPTFSLKMKIEALFITASSLDNISTHRLKFKKVNFSFRFLRTLFALKSTIYLGSIQINNILTEIHTIDHRANAAVGGIFWPFN